MMSKLKEIVSMIKEKLGAFIEKLKTDKKALVAFCVGAICLVVGLGGVIGILVEYIGSDTRHSKAESEFTSGGYDNLGKIEANEIEWYEFARVDIAALKEKYPDVVGWIMFENEKISYPIMQAADNSKYLTIGYDGTQQKAGSIFMDAINSANFVDGHTIIYGHNMQNKSMFGRLKYYKTNDDYYETHKYFQIFTETEILRYEIFFYQDVSVDSYIYQDRTISVATLANNMEHENMVDTDIEVVNGDRVITLSTCTQDDDKRFVVSAVLVDTYSLENDETTESSEE